MSKFLVVFIAACAGMLLFGISLITLGAVATDLKEKFALDGRASGTLFSILPFGILTGSLLFGAAGDRYGYKWLLVISCIAMFAGFEGIASAGSLNLLKVCIYIFGVGGGVVNGSTNAVVSDISVLRKGANLSLLGVFFGLGALGMPLILSIIPASVSSLCIVSVVGWITLATGMFYAFIPFPAAKQKPGSVNPHLKTLFTPLLLLIAFFLFFQSSFEAIINNWATTYLINRGVMTRSGALFALSLHIAGMVTMRLLTGSVLRKISHVKIMWLSIAFLAAGIVLMEVAQAKTIVVTGLFLSGAGLAGGFPIMLGIAGQRFAAQTGTAFSLLFTVALIGNMIINYFMGIIVQEYGVDKLTTASYTEIAAMAILLWFIYKNTSTIK